MLQFHGINELTDDGGRNFPLFIEATVSFMFCLTYKLEQTKHPGRFAEDFLKDIYLETKTNKQTNKKHMHVELNFKEVCSEGPNWQYASMSSGDGEHYLGTY